MARSGDPGEVRVTIEEDVSGLLHALHEFFVSGSRSSEEEPQALYPVVAMSLLESGNPYQEYPLFLPEGGDRHDPASLREMIQAALKAEGCGEVLERLQPYLLAIVAEASQLGMDWPAALTGALEKLRQEADLSDSARAAYDREVKVLLKALPGAGRLVPLRAESWFSFLRWASAREKQPVRRKVREEISKLADQIDVMLQADDSLRPSARSEASLRASLGQSGSFIDLTRLSGSVPQPKGPVGLSPERRARLERVHRTLEEFLARVQVLPEGFLVHSRDTVPFALGPGWTDCQVDNPFESALRLSHVLTEETLDFLKAVRTARYEVEGIYDPGVHGASIERLSWEMCSSEELAFVPQLVIWESVDRLFAENLRDLHRVLEEGRPIHVVLTTEGPLPDPDCGRLAGVIADPGFLGISYREVFVLQSSVGSPWHLLQGLRRMTQVPGPAICVVAFPSGEGVEENWQRWLCAWLSRSLPSYLYDPWLGDSWAERFSLAGNFEPSESGVTARLDWPDGQDREVCLEERITLAHAAALDSRFREYFWVLPDSIPSAAALLTVGEYLDRHTKITGLTIPFIWVADSTGRLRKAAVSSRLLSACLDRQRAWRMLQEMAGIRNVHVERAVAETKSESSRESEARLEAERLAAREEGAREAVEKLVRFLAEPDALLLEEVAPGPSSQVPHGFPAAERQVVREEASKAAEPAQSAPPQPGPAGEEEPESSEPYIDSFLCTSCNDCINANSRMFKYNQDRQAYIADPTAGAFLELVKAAEACPARCIHPGAPRPGDATVTEDLLRRAKVFR